MNFFVETARRKTKSEVSEAILYYFAGFSVGEGLHILLPLPVPASVYGLVLMLGALASGILKLEQVEEAADFLVEIMPVMFVPAGVGLLEAWGDLQPIWLPVVLITILTTVIVMVVTGRSTQFVIRKDRGKIRNDKFYRKFPVFRGGIKSGWI